MLCCPWPSAGRAVGAQGLGGGSSVRVCGTRLGGLQSLPGRDKLPSVLSSDGEELEGSAGHHRAGSAWIVTEGDRRSCHRKAPRRAWYQKYETTEAETQGWTCRKPEATPENGWRWRMPSSQLCRQNASCPHRGPGSPLPSCASLTGSKMPGERGTLFLGVSARVSGGDEPG